MCWVGRTVKEATPIIASADVFVYKILEKDDESKHLWSPVRGMTYHIGHTYEVKGVEPNNFYDEGGLFRSVIERGLHFYDGDCFIGQILDSKLWKCCLYINSKNCLWHSYMAISNACTPTIVKCKIPKGTKYYINRNGEIVTEKVVVLAEITEPISNHICEPFKKIKYE